MEAGIHELTAGYALDALDPEDRRAYEAHLEECASCREELSQMWQAADALALAATGPEPPPSLRGRILAAAQAEPQVVVPLAPRRSRTSPVLAGVAAVAAVLALAVGLWATQLSSDLDETRSALERERAVAAVLTDPSARTVALESGEGHLVVDDDGRAVLVVDALDAAPEGKTYEIWIASDGEDPVRAGLFSGAHDRDVVPVEGTVGPGQVVLVTVEPAGGVDAPTTAPIVGSMPA
jgi:anti-sigma-K factor RskA